MLGKGTIFWRLSLLVIVALVVTGCVGGPSGGPSQDPTRITGVETGVGEFVSVMLGTPAADVIDDALPEKVTVSFNNAASQTVPVIWEAPAGYDPDTATDYTFKGSFTARELTGDIEVIVRLVGEVVVDGNITTATMWTSDFSYLVKGRIVVGAQLTIEPGVLIRFDKDASLHIEGSGVIIANGTEQERIRFTGTKEDRGWWRGIRVGTTSTRNSMKYVIIEYAGGGELDISTPVANLVVGGWEDSGNGRLVLQNSILRHGAGYGLNVRNSSVLADSGNNTYTRNADGPAILRLDTIHYLDGDSNYTGNDHDHVVLSTDGALRGSVINTNDQRTWQALNVPYRVSGWLQIDKSTITIEPKAQFEFTQDAGLLFQQDSTLKIGAGPEVGVVYEDDHVLFTGIEKIPGYWRGIQVESTKIANFMNGVTIEYAGSSQGVITISPANLIVGGRDSDGHLALQNSILRHGSSYGLNIRGNSNLTNSLNNTYRDNAEGPVKASARMIHYLDGLSSYSGNKNDNDFIFVDRNVSAGEPAIGTNDTRTWVALDVPYRFSESMRIENSTIRIEAGAEFEFAQDQSLEFYAGATLIANGTTAEPITFTGVEKIAGYWSGIQFATLTDNQMNHVIIEYGGGRRVDLLEPATNLLVGGSNQITGRLTLRDSIIRNSKGLGLLVLPGSITNPDIATSNQFSNNQEGDYDL